MLKRVNAVVVRPMVEDMLDRLLEFADDKRRWDKEWDAYVASSETPARPILFVYQKGSPIGGTTLTLTSDLTPVSCKQVNVI
jgi:predicted methyltransferase